MNKFKLYTDGGARGNPGPASTGWLIFDAGELVDFGGEYLGVTTNNQAEYRALLAGLTALVKLGADTVTCYLDSELIVKQLTGAYKIKDPGLKELSDKIKTLTEKLNKVEYVHIRRDLNRHADKIVNLILDTGQS